MNFTLAGKLLAETESGAHAYFFTLVFLRLLTLIQEKDWNLAYLYPLI